jgi:hypothetical protein
MNGECIICPDDNRCIPTRFGNPDKPKRPVGGPPECSDVTAGTGNLLPIPLRSGRALSQLVLPVYAPIPDDAYGRKRGENRCDSGPERPMHVVTVLPCGPHFFHPIE